MAMRGSISTCRLPAQAHSSFPLLKKSWGKEQQNVLEAVQAEHTGFLPVRSASPTYRIYLSTARSGSSRGCLNRNVIAIINYVKYMPPAGSHMSD